MACMACRGCWECLLKILNFLMTLTGLAIVAYGVYLFVMFEKSSSSDIAPTSADMVQLGRPMLMATNENFGTFVMQKFDIDEEFQVHIFIYWCWRGSLCNILFRLYWSSNTEWMLPDLCILNFSSLVHSTSKLACAAFIFFDKSWEDVSVILTDLLSFKMDIPTDKTGDFDMIYEFLDDNWELFRWVALGIVIFQTLDKTQYRHTHRQILKNYHALLFLLALIVRAANRPVEYDSDDEYIGVPRQQIRQPLMNRPPVPTTGVPVAGSLDQRPGRNDAWSARMREKYGLDTAEFTYNPSESNRYPQAAAQPAEERGRCTILDNYVDLPEV
ncbi:hypothetical protein HYC85_001312 [Camellia sinensis]|uniref:Tobamovirus multiplication protein 2A n=1 Tax=Camellia sinensis TaxID=4442 RepID=A0A7J7I525_CAMSI|nr:hypothetical protein HYC85_001312 [Camellia sinensis]